MALELLRDIESHCNVDFTSDIGLLSVSGRGLGRCVSRVRRILIAETGELEQTRAAAVLGGQAGPGNHYTANHL